MAAEWWFAEPERVEWNSFGMEIEAKWLWSKILGQTHDSVVCSPEIFVRNLSQPTNL